MDLRSMKLSRQNRILLITGISTLCLGLIAAVVIWQVEKTLGAARGEQLRDADLGVDVRTVVNQTNPGFEAIGAPAVFKGMACFEGKLLLSGPQGLSVYSADGALEKVYRVGMELPTAPLGRIVVGMVAGARQPEALIATSGAGVLAFDGSGFRQIVSRTADARVVTALLPLSSGRLLIGTARLGLLVFDGRTLRRFHPTLDNQYITTLAGNESTVWAGTLNAGLLVWQGGQTTRIAEEQGLPDHQIEAIATNGDSAYVGTPMGVAEVRSGKVLRTLAQGTFAHALLVDGSSLLVGQMDSAIAHVTLAHPESELSARRPIAALSTTDENRKTPAHNAKNAAAVQIATAANEAMTPAIEELLKDGEIRYALTGNALLEARADGEWHKILSAGAAQLTDRNISSLAMASDGRLWVGYFDRGLDLLSTNGATTHIENEQVFCINRILEDPRQSLMAVATANGLALFGRDGHERQVLNHDSGLIASHVTDVALYGEGMALATPAGITFLEPGGAHSIYAFQGLVNNHVYALAASGEMLTAGTLGGISLLRSGSVQRNLTVANSGLKHNWITAFAAAGGDWLLGTYGAGIERLSADGRITPTDVTGMIVNPTAMASDGQHIVAGTLGNGLLVADRTGTRWHAVTSGLPSLNVTAVALANGILYVGTENGLVRIAEDKL